MSDHQIIPMGRFGAPHGIKGWIRLISYSHPAKKILDYEPWMISHHQKDWETIEIIDTTVWSKKILILPKGSTSPESVRHLVNATIGVNRNHLATLETGYYWIDLIDLKVTSIEGFEFGHVDSLLETGAHDVMVIKNPSTHTEYLIPFREPEVIKSVNFKEKQILVDWEAY